MHGCINFRQSSDSLSLLLVCFRVYVFMQNLLQKKNTFFLFMENKHKREFCQATPHLHKATLSLHKNSLSHPSDLLSRNDRLSLCVRALTASLKLLHARAECELYKRIGNSKRRCGEVFKTLC